MIILRNERGGKVNHRTHSVVNHRIFLHLNGDEGEGLDYDFHGIIPNFPWGVIAVDPSIPCVIL